MSTFARGVAYEQSRVDYKITTRVYFSLTTAPWRVSPFDADIMNEGLQQICHTIEKKKEKA